MQVKKFQNKEEWLDARRGKITGSRLKDIVVKRGTGEKIGFYEIIAERLATTPETENPMDRGIRLEDEAIQKYSEMNNLEFDTSLVIWEKDNNPNIAISPDGFMGSKEAIEVKCLSSARHIEARLTNKHPKEYHEQIMQYFIVNDDLEKLHFVMYDPRMPENLQIVAFVINRGDVEQDIVELCEYQTQKLKEIDEIINKLTF